MKSILLQAHKNVNRSTKKITAAFLLRKWKLSHAIFQFVYCFYFTAKALSQFEISFEYHWTVKIFPLFCFTRARSTERFFNISLWGLQFPPLFRNCCWGKFLKFIILVQFHAIPMDSRSNVYHLNNVFRSQPFSIFYDMNVRTFV